MIRTVQQRALIACSALAICFTAFSFRLVDLQVTKHTAYAAKAASQNVHKEPIFARRGTIVDIRGEPLAQNEPVKTVIADASLIRDQSALAERLAATLDMPLPLLREKLADTVPAKGGKGEVPCRYIVLKRDVPEATANQLTELLVAARKEDLVYSTKALRFEQDSIRIYPNGSMLCHILGYLNDGGRGIDGIEASMDRQLQGTNGYRFIERDRADRELVPYRGMTSEPRDGATVRLTIDMGLQQIVENEIDAAMKKYTPKKACIVMMNPKTGEIMALANRPNYDPNEITTKNTERRKNIAITDQFEPGSTFKIVVAAGALNERIVRPETEIFCENGYWASCRLKDSHPYGALSVHNVLVKSSNIGAAKLAIQLGDQKFYEYVRRFGFGECTAVALPGEIRGTVAPSYEWGRTQITRIAMGQAIAATPLQVTAAMGTIANGGTLMLPQIVHEVTDSSGQIVGAYPPREIRRVAPQATAEQVRAALIDVTGLKGTAPRASVPGFKVAGKTGTAQKPDENGRMAHDKYVVSFVGFMPAEDPAFVALVMLDEPHSKTESVYGGTMAAPVFAELAGKAARYLNLQPTEPIVVDGAKLTQTEVSPRAGNRR